MGRFLLKKRLCGWLKRNFHIWKIDGVFFGVVSDSPMALAVLFDSVSAIAGNAIEVDKFLDDVFFIATGGGGERECGYSRIVLQAMRLSFDPHDYGSVDRATGYLQAPAA